MKGIIFTELVSMVEEHISPTLIEEIISENHLPSEGQYTAIGTYDFSEMVTLLSALSEKTGKPIPDLLLTFGEYLFGCFVRKYPIFFREQSDFFTFVRSIETTIHVEVKKLYPAAVLPRFQVVQDHDHGVDVMYESTRHLPHLAEGLLRGCAAHFEEEVSIRWRDVSTGDHKQVLFELRTK